MRAGPGALAGLKVFDDLGHLGRLQGIPRADGTPAGGADHQGVPLSGDLFGQKVFHQALQQVFDPGRVAQNPRDGFTRKALAPKGSRS